MRGKRLAIGIVCGVIAAVSMFLYASQVRAEEKAAREESLARYGGEQVEVCVAVTSIPAGALIEADDVEVRMWLADLLPADCITDPALVVGAVAASAILENEPISERRLGADGGEVAVPDGLCAVSVPFREEDAVGGAIRRGSLVNVYSTSDSGVVLVGENLLVLDTNNSSEGASARSALAWVTLAVTPESVQELLSVARSEHLYLALPALEGADMDADAGEHEEQATESMSNLSEEGGSDVR